MSFQKPSTISTATLNDYGTVFQRRLAATQAAHPAATGHDVVDHLVADLIREKPDMAKATFRKYKAAILYVLRESIRRPGRDPTRILSAITLLAAEPATGCRRRGTKTSSGKCRSIPVCDVERMLRHLQGGKLRSRWVEPTSLAMRVLILTGARPCELAGLRVEAASPERATVTIANAKASNGRAHGTTRTLELSGLTGEESDALVRWPPVLASMSPRYTPAAAIKQIGLYFRDAARAALAPRKRYPTLYSLRHQFAADAKASGHSTEEVAALMGHASDITATRHYGRRRQGNGGIKASALPSEVARVRKKAKTFAPRHPGLAPR